MEWTKFNTHGESFNRAFEVMCNILFEVWCKDEYGTNLTYFAFVNGSGGDGGVESFGLLNSGEVIGIQSKWFPNKLNDSHIKQIESSFYTAIKVRPTLKKYVVCVPRDLTSKKNVKNNQVAKNTEEFKWIKLCEKLNKDYPEVIIELWDETTIQKRLMNPKVIGCYKYWFENTEIFEEEIINSYQKVVNGWAKTKYIPDLYSKGYIHNVLESFVGTYEKIKQRCDKINDVISKLILLRQSYKDILRLNISEKELYFKEFIESDIKTISEWILKLEGAILLIKTGSLSIDDLLFDDFSLKCSVDILKDSILIFHYFFHFHTVEELLQGINDDILECRKLLKMEYDNRIIILGDAGTGKTSGIVGEANLFFRKKHHLPIIVRAKDFTEGDNWLSIIVKTIGLSSVWSEYEIFMALENAALLRSNQIGNVDDIYVQPICLICVDGIDESSNWEFWKERVEEAKIYEKEFPRIKFVFLARPYVFPRYYKLDYNYCFFNIPSSGDVAVEDLFDEYVKYYNIDIGNNYWIKNVLRTPIALKLFCDLYKKKKIETLPQNSLVLTSLFSNKMMELEKNFGLLEHFVNKHKMVSTVLITIASLLVSKDRVTYEEIDNAITVPIKGHLESLLDFVEKEGFIYSFQYRKDTFSIPETFYSWGMQPAFDYLLARKIYDTIKLGDEISVNYSEGTLQMLSLIALEEDEKLLYQYENVNIDENQYFGLLCFALINASVNVVGKYADYTKNLMNNSIYQFREMVNKVVIPVCRVENHPLGSCLLDDFLRSKKEPAKRDIWWSIPAYLRDNYETKWRSYTEVDISYLNLKDNGYMCTPLLLVWCLSSVNNETRRECRLKLTEWGIENSNEFYKLMVYCADINDEQIIEDLFAIAYGISLSNKIEEDYLSFVSEWIMENVFSQLGLTKYENIAIRYYCAGIVKIAISRGVCDENIKKLVTPPYEYMSNVMPLYMDSIDANRLFGYGPISYDLARYVLCDKLDHFFRYKYNSDDYYEDTEVLISEYEEKYDIKIKEPDGLIISIAYQYLLDNGWEKKLFWEYKDKSNIGVDISILHTFYPSTHGAMSKVMSVAEKYVWLAKHRIEAMLANRVKWRDYGNCENIICDYLDLDSFTNTYQDYINSKYFNHSDKWFHTDQLAIADYSDYSLDNIQKWMNSDKIPDFSTWIENNDNKYIIYAFSNIDNQIAGIEEALWISSGVVKRDDFTKFIEMLNVYSEKRYMFQNVSDFHSNQGYSGFCTPQEICTVLGDREVEDKISFGDDLAINVYTLVVSCLSEHAEKTEKIFYLPNGLARKITGITYGDGYQYLNSNGDVIGIYTDMGETCKNHQNCLLIDSDILSNAMEENEYKIFWLFRVYRCPSNKAYEEFGSLIEHSTDRTFVVWKEDKTYKSIELKDIKPPKREPLSVGLQYWNFDEDKLD